MNTVHEKILQTPVIIADICEQKNVKVFQTCYFSLIPLLLISHQGAAFH